jgi:ribosomal protein S18 acetylase RimI-like enzyme
MVEVDARPTINEERSVEVAGAYMCNLAVDEKCHRQGIASALVQECERQVLEWYEQYKSQPPPSSDVVDISAATFLIGQEGALLTNYTAVAAAATTLLSNSLSLKVRQSNKAAIQLYTKLGYQSLWQEEERKTGETVLVMRKQLSNISKSELM